ncbi:hypothetical protein ACLMJK_007669 [Lecanora helva]
MEYDVSAESNQSDWNFLKGFYQREEMAKQQIHSLNGHVLQLHAALQHAGYNTQQDRRALNKSYEHMKELQDCFQQSESSRARIENDLHDERQEHQMCRENLDYERKRSIETEKHLDGVWESHFRLTEVLSKVKCRIGPEDPDMTYDIADLIGETTAKGQRIRQLEDLLEYQEIQRRIELERHEDQLQAENNRHSQEQQSQVHHIQELERLLQREQMKQCIEEKSLEACKTVAHRRRSRGKGRNKKQDSRGEREEQVSNVQQETRQDDRDLCVIKEESGQEV